MIDVRANGHSLDDSHLIRQCRKWQVEDGLPTLEAFVFSQGRCSLSFSWLEKICIDVGIEVDIDNAIIELEKSPPLTPTLGFMWAVLSVEEVKCSVKDATDKIPKVRFEPTDRDSAHVIVWSWKHCSKKTKKKVAQNLASRLTKSNTRLWPVTPQS